MSLSQDEIDDQIAEERRGVLAKTGRYSAKMLRGLSTESLLAWDWIDDGPIFEFDGDGDDEEQMIEAAGVELEQMKERLEYEYVWDLLDGAGYASGRGLKEYIRPDSGIESGLYEHLERFIDDATKKPWTEPKKGLFE